MLVTHDIERAIYFERREHLICLLACYCRVVVNASLSSLTQGPVLAPFLSASWKGITSLKNCIYVFAGKWSLTDQYLSYITRGQIFLHQRMRGWLNFVLWFFLWKAWHASITYQAVQVRLEWQQPWAVPSRQSLLHQQAPLMMLPTPQTSPLLPPILQPPQCTPVHKYMHYFRLMLTKDQEFWAILRYQGF